MVLPTWTWPRDVPAVGVGVLVFLLWEPQPASPSVAADTATAAMQPISLAEYTRMIPRSSTTRLCGYPIDAVGHAQFTAAVPHGRFAVLVEDSLVIAVDDDVVDDVVGHHDIRRPLHG